MEIPACRPAQREKGLEIGSSSGANALGRRAREREVEEDEVQGPITPSRADSEVVGLEVPVRHPLAFENTDNLQ